MRKCLLMCAMLAVCLSPYYTFGAGAEDYRKAAEQGDAKAQYNLGVCYNRGLGVKEDINEACKWFRKAAEQGMQDAQCKLGIMYLSTKSPEAAQWFRKAAEKGNADAQVSLGICFFSGCGGVKEDADEARKWFLKAAEQGHAAAQCRLGMNFLAGNSASQWREGMHFFGNKADGAKCIEWLRKAAEHDEEIDQPFYYFWCSYPCVAKAQYCLGRCYFDGKAVKRDLDEAEKWLLKAGENYIKIKSLRPIDVNLFFEARDQLEYITKLLNSIQYERKEAEWRKARDNDAIKDLK